MRALFLIASAATFLPAQSPLPRVIPESVGLSSERLREATALLNQYVAEQKVAGAVAAVARRGKLAYLEAVGVQDLATREAMTERSLLRIYSMSKAVTAVAVMMLHEEGTFALDDPVSRVLKAATVEMMTRNGTSDAIQLARGDAQGGGLSNVNVLLRQTANNQSSIGEYSWDGTAGTIFWVDPVKETVIILMSQSAPSNPDQIRQRFKAIVMRAIVD